MARTLYRLTDKLIRNSAKPGYYADGGGLYLQVSKSGTKSWVYRFTLQGKTRDMGLGSLNYVSIADARAASMEARSKLLKGIDPIQDRDRTRATAAIAVAPILGPTFEQFAKNYINSRQDGWRSPKHAAQWHATLRAYVYPVIGSMQLGDIGTAEILKVLEPIWIEKSETASRIRGRIERILAAAAVRDLRPATNPAAWVGHLREALPPKRKGGSFAALPYTEVPAFVANLRNRGSVSELALEFTILTAARSGEARGARWSEIDESTLTWTVPAVRMKAKRPHVVPLSSCALEVLVRAKPLRGIGGDLIFPGVKSGYPLSDMTLSKLVRSMGYAETVHGFRASFKTWAEQETEHANVVIEAALAHVVGDKAERAYMRGDWLAKRRILMDAWGSFCTSPVQNTLAQFGSAAVAA